MGKDQFKECDNIAVREMNTPESHSIIALNLQTVEDVEQVIRQCEALKGQMTDGLKSTITKSKRTLVGSFS